MELRTKGDRHDIRATFEIGTARELKLVIDGRGGFGFDCGKMRISEELFDSIKKKPEANRPLVIDAGRLSVQVLVDGPMKEIFVDDGEMIITMESWNDLNVESVRAVAAGGQAGLISLEAIDLDAGWKRQPARG